MLDDKDLEKKTCLNKPFALYHVGLALYFGIKTIEVKAKLALHATTCLYFLLVEIDWSFTEPAFHSLFSNASNSSAWLGMHLRRMNLAPLAIILSPFETTPNLIGQPVVRTYRGRTTNVHGRFGHCSDHCLRSQVGPSCSLTSQLSSSLHSTKVILSPPEQITPCT